MRLAAQSNDPARNSASAKADWACAPFGGPPSAAATALRGPLVRRQRLVGPSRGLQGRADGEMAPAQVNSQGLVGAERAGQGLAAREYPAVQLQGVLPASHLVREGGHLEVRLQQRPPRGRVGVVLQQGSELFVEAAGRRSAAGRAAP